MANIFIGSLPPFQEETDDFRECEAVRLKDIQAVIHARVHGPLNRDADAGELIGQLVPESQPYVKRILDETLFDEEGFARGEVSYWIPVIVDSRLDANEAIEEWTKWLTVGEEIPPEKLAAIKKALGRAKIDPEGKPAGR